MIQKLLFLIHIIKFVTGQRVLTNTFGEILNCLLFMFLFTSCAHKRSIAEIIKKTTRLPLPQSDITFYLFQKLCIFRSFFIEEKVFKNLFYFSAPSLCQ